jgi:uncharacterized OB-fold protein
MTHELGITAYQCKACGRIHYPFHDRCLNCQQQVFETLKPEGDPKLLTFTQIFNLPWGFDVRFLVMGVVEFSNGIKAMGQVHLDSIEKLKTGMKLKASWEPIRQVSGEDVFGLVLKPK